MYSTMRLQHKAQDCGTAASLSLRRQCWASDRCCYEYDSHVSGLWASQGQFVVAGEGVAGGMPEVKLQAPAEPYNLFMLAALRQVRPLSACQTDLHLLCMPSTIRTGRPHIHSYNSTHTRTHTHTYAAIIALMKFCRRLALCCCCFYFLRTFFGNSPLACGKPPTAKAIIVEWTAPTTRHSTSLSTPSHPKVVASSLAAGWRCSALLCSGRAIISEMFWLALAFMLIYWLLRFCDKSVLLTWCDFASLVPSSLLLIFPLPNTLPPPPGTVVRPRCCGFKLPESFISSNLVLYLLDAAKL